MLRDAVAAVGVQVAEEDPAGTDTIDTDITDIDTDIVGGIITLITLPTSTRITITTHIVILILITITPAIFPHRQLTDIVNVPITTT